MIGTPGPVVDGPNGTLAEGRASWDHVPSTPDPVGLGPWS